ncbi:MAG: hypothetical protein KatS3mg058_1684 [Roseiflexus sp.]|nr:MAG: hypothetical protein KatS3mg058_1684 [Roseiflexus sp.]
MIKRAARLLRLLFSVASNLTDDRQSLSAVRHRTLPRADGLRVSDGPPGRDWRSRCRACSTGSLRAGRAMVAAAQVQPVPRVWRVGMRAARNLRFVSPS